MVRALKKNPKNKICCKMNEVFDLNFEDVVDEKLLLIPRLRV
jgi:hypothetical protein